MSRELAGADEREQKRLNTYYLNRLSLSFNCFEV